MKTFTVKGSNFECGWQIGKKFAPEIRWRLSYLKISIKGIPKGVTHFNNIKGIVQRKFPDYIEEIRGMAEGADVPIEQLLLLNFSELREHNHGCSSIARTWPVTDLSHNEDGDSRERKGMCALITYHLPQNTFTCYNYPGELAGNSFGWNRSGIYHTVNYISIKPQHKFFPSYFVARRLLECKSLLKFENALRSIPSSSGLHYFAGDSRQIISFEHCYNNVSIKKVKGIYLHTNHFLRLSGSRIYNGSKIRYKRLAELMNGEPLAALFDRKNSPWSIYAGTGDVNRTLSTVVFRPKEAKMYLYENRKAYPSLVLKIPLLKEI